MTRQTNELLGTLRFAQDEAISLCASADQTTCLSDSGSGSAQDWPGWIVRDDQRNQILWTPLTVNLRISANHTRINAMQIKSLGMSRTPPTPKTATPTATTTSSFNGPASTKAPTPTGGPACSAVRGNSQNREDWQLWQGAALNIIMMREIDVMKYALTGGTRVAKYVLQGSLWL